MFKKIFIGLMAIALITFFTPTFSDMVGLDDGTAIAKKGHGKGKGKGHNDRGKGKKGKGKGHGYGYGHDRPCPGPDPEPDPDPDPTPDPTPDREPGDSDPNLFWRMGSDGWVNCDTDWKRATLEACKGLPYKAY